MVCDDDSDMCVLVEYNLNCCVYSMMQCDDVNQRWEVVIELVIGNWDIILEIVWLVVSFQLFIGVNCLNDFFGNCYFYIDFNGVNLVVQDLIIFDIMRFVLNDLEIGQKIEGLFFLQEGWNSDEYFLYSGLEGCVYGIDLVVWFLSVVLDIFFLGFDLLNDFVYSFFENYFVFMGQINQGFIEWLYMVMIYDNVMKNFVVCDIFLQWLFGFVFDLDVGWMFVLIFLEN